MNKLVRLVFYVLGTGLPVVGLCANPFASIGSGTTGAVTTQPSVVISTKEVDPEKHPLVRWPLDHYVIMGVLLSENNSIAIIRTPQPHSQTYLLRFGDLLGDSDSLVRTIDRHGIEIVDTSSDEPEKKRLEVRNKGVQMKDSNG